jgi:DNA-binding NarL/FixJ family response regulator
MCTEKVRRTWQITCTEAKVEIIRVLIAEDNAAYRQSLYRTLQEEEGIEVLEPATNAQEAVERSERFQPDVILMDIDMPEQSGLSATRTIRERWPQVKVIILSFHGGEAFRDWAEEVGATAFLPKDADPEEIVRAIRTAGDVTPHLFRK